MRKYKQQGTISIEFAMSSIVLFMMIFAVFELSRFIYINNLVDIAITEASRDSRIHENKGTDDNYKKLLEQSLSQDSLWNSLAIKKGNYIFKEQCYKNFKALTSEIEDKDECNKSELAIYTLTYTYHPLFIFNGVTTRKITRSVLVQNEYQGWKENEA